MSTDDSITGSELAATSGTPAAPAPDLPAPTQEVISGTAAGAATQEPATAAAVIHPSYAKAAAENPEVAAALRLNETFSPEPDVDYGWVLKHAREQFEKAETAFKAADEKAASIMGYLGSGAGLLALGSIAGLAANQLDAWVALCGIPSLVFAGLSLVFAALARRPFDAAYPPSAAGAVSRAKWHPKPTDRKRHSFPSGTCQPRSCNTPRTRRPGGSCRQRGCSQSRSRVWCCRWGWRSGRSWRRRSPHRRRSRPPPPDPPNGFNLQSVPLPSRG